jgi:23S rRNA (uracil1939-C5)-methyltransferase
MKQKPQIKQKINTTIRRLGIQGEGVGDFEGYTVFIDGALPGETVQARLTECKKNYGRGSLIHIENPSSSRVAPPCPLFGRCGGCQVMHLDYEGQLAMKRQRVVDAFERIGKFSQFEVQPCLPSPAPLSYRNKIQAPVRSGPEGLMTGFFARGSHDLVEVEHCYIHCELGEQVFREVRDIVKRSGMTAYDWKTGTGELRFVIIKTAVNTGQALVIFVTHGQESEKLQGVAGQIMERCPAVKGVVRNVNTLARNVVLGEKFYLIAGEDRIEEKISGMTFTVSPPSFFQVNPAQAERLYGVAIEYAELVGDETVLDAFCGVGTLTLLLAKKAGRVIGTECVPQAIADAEANAKSNNISNAVFVCQETETWIKKANDIDVIVLNPPRRGCEPSLLDEIGRLLPGRVVYISCDPATLARDAAHLRTFGYTLDAVQPLDMFPQTAHVETVVKLSRE